MARRLTLDEARGPLLDALRQALDAPSLDYARPPFVIKRSATLVVAIELEGAPPAAAGPLAVKLLLRPRPPDRVHRERAVHEALLELGYPVPRIIAVANGDGPLGRPFVLMERVDGARAFGHPVSPRGLLAAPETFARLQERLHALDPLAFLQFVERRGIPRDAFYLAEEMEQLRRLARRRSRAWTAPALDWLEQHHPGEPERPVLCHGDFHPGNVLMRGRHLAGVIDWAGARVADPALDVASTGRLLVQSHHLPLPLRPVGGVIHRWVKRRYQRICIERWGVSQERIDYYEAFQSGARMVRRFRHRRRDPETFFALTGVRLQPPPPGPKKRGR